MSEPVQMTPKRKALLDKLGHLMDNISDEGLMELSGFASALLCGEPAKKAPKPATVIQFKTKKPQ